MKAGDVKINRRKRERERERKRERERERERDKMHKIEKKIEGRLKQQDKKEANGVLPSYISKFLTSDVSLRAKPPPPPPPHTHTHILLVMI